MSKAAPTGISSAQLLVQVVEIRWTKATRGAPRANERAVLPRAFAAIALDAVFGLQIWRMDEQDGFLPRLVQDATSDSIPMQQSGLLLQPANAEDNGAIVLGMEATTRGGRPRRRAVLAAVRLLPGQTARVLTNARHSSYSGQHYSETIYNVAYGTGITSDRFLRAAPDHLFSTMADLF